MEKFKVGQQWKNREGEIRTIKYISDASSTLYPVLDDVSFSYTKDGVFNIGHESNCDLIELVKDVEDEKMSEELKLEAGKKYNFDKKFSMDNPCKLVAIDDGDYIFKDKYGACFSFMIDHDSLKSIKEHREPYKKNITKWVRFNSNKFPNRNFETDNILNLNTSGIYLDSKKEAFEGANKHEWPAVAKVEITITQEITEGSADA